MVKYYKFVGTNNLKLVSEQLKNFGYDVRAFPVTNFPNKRKLEISFGGSLAQQLNAVKKKKESNIDKYLSDY